MADKTSRIGEIIQVMQNTWDLPADCNEGELFTYAEALYDRIAAGDSKDKLYAYLSEVQVDHLEMATSDAFRAIVDRAISLIGASKGARRDELSGALLSDGRGSQIERPPASKGPCPAALLRGFDLPAGFPEAPASAGSLQAELVSMFASPTQLRTVVRERLRAVLGHRRIVR